MPIEISITDAKVVHKELTIEEDSEEDSEGNVAMLAPWSAVLLSL